MLDLDGHEPHVYLHPADAEARGIKHGDAVAAYNDRGEHAGTAFVTDHVKQGSRGARERLGRRRERDRGRPVT